MKKMILEMCLLFRSTLTWSKVNLQTDLADPADTLQCKKLTLISFISFFICKVILSRNNWGKNFVKHAIFDIWYFSKQNFNFQRDVDNNVSSSDQATTTASTNQPTQSGPTQSSGGSAGGNQTPRRILRATRRQQGAQANVPPGSGSNPAYDQQLFQQVRIHTIYVIESLSNYCQWFIDCVVATH